MTVSGVKGNSVFGGFPKVGKKEVAQTETPQKKVNVKKALAIASAAAAAVGLGLIAVNKIKKGQMVPKTVAEALPKDFAFGQDNIKKLVNLKGAAQINNQIAEVTSRTSPAVVKAKAAALADVFGGVVEHVPQRASIVG